MLISRANPDIRHFKLYRKNGGKIMVNWISVILGVLVLGFMIADNFFTMGIGLIDEPILLPIGIGLIVMGFHDSGEKKNNKKNNKKKNH